MGAFKDLTGQKFGKLTVVEKSNQKSNGAILWLCECECGNKTLVRTGHLRSRSVISCGCVLAAKRKDLTGVVFGKLKVIKQAQNINGVIDWLCKCECGNHAIVRTCNLNSGSTISCGCVRKANSKESGKKYTELLNERYLFDGTKINNLKMRKAKNNKSGVKGVFWDKERQKWQAKITIKSKDIYLGRFDKLEDAIQARKQAEEIYFKPVIEEFEALKEGTSYGKTFNP